MGYLKDHLYENNQKTFPELKQAITKYELITITKQEFIRMIDNFARCLQACHQQKWTFQAHIAMCFRRSEDFCRFVEMQFFKIFMFSSFPDCFTFVTVMFGYKDIMVLLGPMYFDKNQIF